MLAILYDKWPGSSNKPVTWKQEWEAQQPNKIDGSYLDAQVKWKQMKRGCPINDTPEINKRSSYNPINPSY